jgi:uncharacterized membrane protein YedE/YeeE
MNAVIALVSGLVFGLGLIVSDMASPAKVLGFLDVAGAWDPSLGFVMAGAIAVAAPAFALTRRRRDSWAGLPLQPPTQTRIDRRLVGGSLLFGIGWGLAGLCPGPAVALLGMGRVKALVFVLAMGAGMALHAALQRRAAGG